MNVAEERIALLLTLHDLARLDGRADLGTVAGRLGWGVGRVVRVLAALDAKGLVDRPRCRLTMAGLAIAATLDAHRVHSRACA
ncbi:MAG: hypothetical protein KC619_06475 [Myxococcales bacterium]|nr:hypothetical protein [Myxococcales bacterium]